MSGLRTPIEKQVPKINRLVIICPVKLDFQAPLSLPDRQMYIHPCHA